MRENQAVSSALLEAASPFELRVDLGKHVPESDVRTAQWRRGIPALVHDRRYRRRPWCARRRVDGRVHVAVPLLPQPRHLDDDQWNSSDGDEGG
jgi:hypothetical protein